jgi:hypothetical protein
MQPIPEDILNQFDVVLTQKAVPSSLHDEYRKWLKYYLDFRVKYPLPDIKYPLRAEQNHEGPKEPTGF